MKEREKERKKEGRGRRGIFLTEFQIITAAG